MKKKLPKRKCKNGGIIKTAALGDAIEDFKKKAEANALADMSEPEQVAEAATPFAADMSGIISPMNRTGSISNPTETPAKFDPALSRSLQDFGAANNRTIDIYGTKEDQEIYDRYNTKKDRQPPYWQMGYFPGLTAQFAHNAREDKTNAAYAQDPKDQAGFTKAAKANTAGAWGAGFQALATGVESILGPISGQYSYQQGKKAEQESFNLHNRERADVKAYRGKGQLGDNPVMTKFGGQAFGIPIAMHGTEAEDYKDGKHNVIDEVGETVAVPATNTNPPAVFPAGGVPHSHPNNEKVNKKAYPDKTAILTKRLHLKKDQAIAAFGEETEVGQRIAANVEGDVVSHADLGALYDTKALAKEQEMVIKDLVKLAKKKETMIKKQNPGQTKVSQVTDKISTVSLSDQASELAKRKQEIEQEMAYNSHVVRNMMLPLQEDMKDKGMYGNVDNVETAKFGKKVRLPKAETGKYVNGVWISDDSEALSVPKLETPMVTSQEIDNNPIFEDRFYPDLNTRKAQEAVAEQIAGPDNYLHQEDGALNLPLTNRFYDKALETIPFKTGQGASDYYPTTAGNTPANATPPVITPGATPAGYTYLKGPGRFQEKTGSKTADTKYAIGANQIDDVEYSNRVFEENEAAKKAGLPTIPELTDEEMKSLGIDKTKMSADDLTNARIQSYHYKRLMATPEGRKALAQEVMTLGRTKQGIALGVKPFSGDITKLKNEQELTDYLNENYKSFVDAKNTKRWGTEGYKPKGPQQGPVTPPIKGVDDPLGAVPSANILKRKGHRYYQEGLHPWQLAGEFATLFDGYEPATYVEDHGAADALAGSTRPQMQNDAIQQARTAREARAMTRYTDPSTNAQIASNAWQKNNESSATTRALNAQTEDRFQERQNDLRMKAGTNKAAALRQLVVDTAKGHSAFTNRNINAWSLMGNKYAQNVKENREALLIQDMFPNIAYNPWTGTEYTGSSTLRTPGENLNPRTKEEYAALAAEAKAARAEADLQRAQIRATTTATRKYGGKVKLPTKSVKTGKSVK